MAPGHLLSGSYGSVTLVNDGSEAIKVREAFLFHQRPKRQNIIAFPNLFFILRFRVFHHKLAEHLSI